MVRPYDILDLFERVHVQTGVDHLRQRIPKVDEDPPISFFVRGGVNASPTGEDIDPLSTVQADQSVVACTAFQDIDLIVPDQDVIIRRACDALDIHQRISTCPLGGKDLFTTSPVGDNIVVRESVTGKGEDVRGEIDTGNRRRKRCQDAVQVEAVCSAGSRKNQVGRTVVHKVQLDGVGVDNHDLVTLTVV